MLLGKQSDVKKHLSSLHHSKLHLIPAASPPATNAGSSTSLSSIAASSATFAADFSEGHAATGPTVTPAANAEGFADGQPFKSTQA
jgi:hypothetical protein